MPLSDPLQVSSAGLDLAVARRRWWLGSSTSFAVSARSGSRSSQPHFLGRMEAANWPRQKRKFGLNLNPR